ncbi:microsomal glutathione S-transferase 2 [Protopterus annectens]|uniref:microsomal glutathione S-transferase 2 n=1 Tax=Protopterus annectens TaxID=7888 RepID=UPI001CFB7828|nr:microsomal glutathione S-transferase 2 [Protopterus annectens]
MAVDTSLLAVISLLSAMQQVYFIKCLRRCRTKPNTTSPASSGNEEFDSTFEAKLQSIVGGYPAFLVCFWIAGWFVSQGVAAVLGLVYMCGYHWRFCMHTAKERSSDFYLSDKALQILAVIGAVGVFTALLDEYLDFNIMKKIYKLF